MRVRQISPLGTRLLHSLPIEQVGLHHHDDHDDNDDHNDHDDCDVHDDHDNGLSHSVPIKQAGLHHHDGCDSTATVTHVSILHTVY